MAREPRTKGTSILPLVHALKNLPNGREIVPKALLHYLDEPILVSGWYPEREFFLLLDALVATIDPATVGGDTWHFFGVLAAQRDIGGSQEQISEENRTEVQGLYRSFASRDANDVERFVKRALRLWNHYHDTGSMEIRGGRVKTNSFNVRLTGFRIPLEGYERLQIGYTEEYARLAGIPLKGRVIRSTARGDSWCEWEYSLDRTPPAVAFVASLPPLSD